jgi:hypothetical protein
LLEANEIIASKDQRIQELEDLLKQANSNDVNHELYICRTNLQEKL